VAQTTAEETDEADLLDAFERLASIGEATRDEPHHVGVELDQALADRRVPVLTRLQTRRTQSHRRRGGARGCWSSNQGALRNGFATTSCWGKMGDQSHPMQPP
jgi:hypothetical protein